MERLLILLLRLVVVIGDSLVIKNPIDQNLGTYGEWDECAPGLYASGFQLKLELYKGPILIGTIHGVIKQSQDNTYVNAIRLICSPIGSNKFDTRKMPSSLVGRAGQWLTVQYCDHGTMIGFQFRSEPDQYAGDDTAGNNLKVYCAGINQRKYWVEGDGASSGRYTEEQYCRKEQAIRAIRTQVDLRDPESNIDLHGLVNVEMRCEDIKNPTDECLPMTSFQLVLECNNINGSSAFECKYEATEGVSTSEAISETQISSQQVLESIGFEAEASYSIVEAKFSIDKTWTEETGEEQTDVSSTFWQQEVTRSFTVPVPANRIARVYQVVGTCGVLEVGSIEFINTQRGPPIPQPYPAKGFVCKEPPEGEEKIIKRKF